MEGINLDTNVQAVTILGGIIALFLALLQIIETYVDIGDKLRKRRLDRKNQAPRQARNHNQQLFNGDKLDRTHKSSLSE
jgi:hypothetical protein